MNFSKSKQFNLNRNLIIAAILLASLVLRWVLVLRGGQYYISDETRYEVSRAAAQLLVQRQVEEALKQFTLSPEHVGFKVIGLAPALLEQITGPSLALPAMFFSLFSALNLFLIFLVSQRTSLSSDEPLFALVLAACSHSLLYYARHLFPYDLSMSFGLLALYSTVAREQNAKTSLLCGTLGFLCFITYNGYWSLALFVMLANIVLHSETIPTLLRKTLFTVLGFVTPLALLIIAMLGAGMNMLSAYRLFATSITQGSFQEGWSLPFEYLWHAEHIVILVLGVLSVIAIMSQIGRGRQVIALWATGVLFIYLCLFILSVVLYDFVVYGRLARQMLPFIILLSANGLVQVEHRNMAGHKVTGLILTLVLTQAAWNFGLSYQLSYPRQLTEDLQVRFPTFEFSTKRLAFGAPTVCQSGGYIIENAKYFLSAPETSQPVLGEILWEAPHPVNFLPYQYEGFTPEQRQKFREGQLRMRFYKVDDEFISGPGREIKNCAIR